MSVSRENKRSEENIRAQIDQKISGNRRRVFHGGTLCSGCYAEPPLPGQRYGIQCKRKAAREFYHKKQEEFRRLKALVGGGK